MEICNGHCTKALSFFGQATAIPIRKAIGYYGQSEGVHKSLKVSVLLNHAKPFTTVFWIWESLKNGFMNF